MNKEDFQEIARQGALDALKTLAAIAVDPTVIASDREHARSMVEQMLDQASNKIPPDLRQEIKNVLHKQSSEAEPVRRQRRVDRPSTRRKAR